jgi:hypothetical protein
MPVTTTSKDTLKVVLDRAHPATLADALAKVDLGTVLTPIVLDTGVITASATITLSPPALLVQSARIVSSGTAGSVGSYLLSDTGAVMAIPAGGANLTPGVGRISADGATVTFPNTVTQAVIQYIPRSATDLASQFPAAS